MCVDLETEWRFFVSVVYLLCSSRLSHLRRHLQSFPGESRPPAARRCQRGPAEGRRSSGPLQPALWAGTLIPRRSCGSLHSHGNPRCHFSYLTFVGDPQGQICESGCIQPSAAPPRPRREAGRSSTFPPDTPIDNCPLM